VSFFTNKIYTRTIVQCRHCERIKNDSSVRFDDDNILSAQRNPHSRAHQGEMVGVIHAQHTLEQVTRLTTHTRNIRSRVYNVIS